ncbi:MAG: UDP-N-acetylglucosamine--N-acetylmuramyl-(pentapeptide) pyrophosphoryl-undecaprenol N-acetylglucosamine transferase [Puniceicoccales bacterium]|nr:UDP-N-acetylglucosamine--N-acetylmuramyl-(pentapeptide) pyrophosphoryl-undecaprenol N-acetylglucosamine transferase [Puniceicoccales bacterium]
MSRYAIACGGTGGHLSPGVAIAEELVSRGEECLLLTSEKAIDCIMLRKYAEFECVALAAKPFGRGIKKIWQFLRSQAVSFFFCLRLLKKRNIRCVIGMGSFTNVPVALAAFAMGKKIVLHESNRIIGKSIRSLAYFAHTVFLPEDVAFGKRFLDKKVLHVAMPLRRELSLMDKGKARKALGLNGDGFVVGVLGGSQGANALNEWASQNLEKLNSQSIAVCCVRGVKNFKSEVVTGKSSGGGDVVNVFLHFCDDMRSFLSAVDLLVCRAGAGTIAEAVHFSLPMVLVPFPNAADNHQEANATYAEKNGWAVTVREDNIGALTKVIFECFSEKLANFKVDSTSAGENRSVEIIVDRIQKISANG